MIFLDNVIDVGNCGADQESKNKGDNVVLTGPDVKENSAENRQEWESPTDSVDDDSLSGREELIDN